MIEGLVSELLNGEMSLVGRWRDGIRSQLYILPFYFLHLFPNYQIIFFIFEVTDICSDE